MTTTQPPACGKISEIRARDSMLNEGGIISHEALSKLRAALTKAKP